MKKENMRMFLGGLLIGMIGIILAKYGNPGNMGICIACFLRDIAGGLKWHQAPAVQYIRPEIVGIVFGAFLASVFSKDFKSRGGSSSAMRFVYGVFMMIGALVFLGCPLRMILRLAAGDLNAMVGLFGFIGGIFVGLAVLKKGFTLGRAHESNRVSGKIMVVVAVVLLLLLYLKPAFIAFSKEGPGSQHAPVWMSLIGGAVVGVILQRTRICSAAAFRDIILIKNPHYFFGVFGIFMGALVLNLILNFNQLHIGFANQPIAHSNHLWNFLGMSLVGLTGVLLGGCPIRQLILSSDGDQDAIMTVMGLLVGAAISHNFGLASSAKGATAGGQIATVIGLGFVILTSVIIARMEERR